MCNIQYIKSMPKNNNILFVLGIGETGISVIKKLLKNTPINLNTRKIYEAATSLNNINNINQELTDEIIIGIDDNENISEIIKEKFSKDLSIKKYYEYAVLSNKLKIINSTYAEKLLHKLYNNNDNDPNADTNNLNAPKIKEFIISPGIPAQPNLTHKLIKIAKHYHIPIKSDIDLFYKFNQKQKQNQNDNKSQNNKLHYYIGITGTNGKSTTTSLLYHIFKTTYANYDVYIGGNIGTPALNIDINYDNKLPKIFILELSSYQIDLSYQIKLDYCICINITPDHLDRYGDITHYAESKKRIFELSNICAKKIISIDYPETINIYNDIKKCNNNIIAISNKNNVINNNENKMNIVSVVNNILYINADINSQNIKYKKDISDYIPYSLIGNHNAENIAAAISICIDFINNSATNKDDKDSNFNNGITKILNAISTFIGLKHRMEKVHEINTDNKNNKSKRRIIFINDSKATNIDSTKYALESFDNIYWILGGISKDDGIECLNHMFNKIKCAYLIGQSSLKFASILDKYNVKYVISGDLQSTLVMLKKMLDESSDKSYDETVVLLSPACSSLDQWKNFEARGEYFTDTVRKLWE